MNRLKTLVAVLALSVIAAFASAGHDEPWWCDVPFIGKFLPGCDANHGDESNPPPPGDPTANWALCNAPSEECAWH